MTKMLGIYSVDEHKEMMRKNLSGQVRNSGIGATTGLEQVITTCTDIIAGVIPTLFYELNMSSLSSP